MPFCFFLALVCWFLGLIPENMFVSFFFSLIYMRYVLCVLDNRDREFRI
jgi:hypothetical protein